MTTRPDDFAPRPAAQVACPACGHAHPAGLLACPNCGRLTYGQRLAELAAQARAATERGDRTEAITLWREALQLLPADTNQYQTIAANIVALGREIDAGAPPGKRTDASKTGKPRIGTIAGIGAVALSILTKGKFLLLGLSKLPLLLSMLGYIGVYWALWGWKFAVGLALSIYVHEMGHVAAIRRYGMKATAPMFIPGLGALIRLQERPIDEREDGRIGLAGPEWGLGAALVCLVVYLVGQSAGWAGAAGFGAIAKVGAWINLFNLLPVWSLDGSRGFRAMGVKQRWTVVALIAALAAAAWQLAGVWEGLLILIGIVMAYRTVTEKPEGAHRDVFVRFVVLLVALVALTLLHVPTQI